ncbi:hypothetical protein F4819DRAFT_323311 [Hypoxylon fuscum]|nr:hypothetical protein F4819DRAFT_323311 [Hypoxylon fuscum]
MCGRTWLLKAMVIFIACHRRVAAPLAYSPKLICMYCSASRSGVRLSIGRMLNPYTHIYCTLNIAFQPQTQTKQTGQGCRSVSADSGGLARWLAREKQSIRKRRKKTQGFSPKPQRGNSFPPIHPTNLHRPFRVSLPPKT